MAYEYFAAQVESRKAVEGVIARIRKYRNVMRDTGRAQRMLRAWRTVYGWAPDGVGDTSALRPSGAQGELLDLTTNDFAALVRQAAVLTTSSRPAFKSVASNTDYDSHAQAVLADGLLEHYDRTSHLGTLDREAVAMALITSEAWQVQAWDVELGAELSADENASGGVMHEGDVAFHVLTAFEVAYDPDVRTTEALQWFCFKTSRSRADLREKLLRMGKQKEADKLGSGDGTTTDVDPDARAFDVRTRATTVDRDEKDQVDVWEFRHLPTLAVPNGRLIQFCGADLIIHDSVGDDGQGGTKDAGLPYDGLHAFRLTPEIIIGSNFSHTPFFDLLSLQEGLDMVATAMATATNAGGISNIWVPPGDVPDVSQLAGGLNVIVSNTKPEPLQAVKLDPQALEFASMCLDMMRRRVGFNSAALGEPTKGMPAQAMALLQAQAVQFHSDLQEAYVRFVERTRTGLLKMLRRFANTKRVAAIAGKSNRWAMREFTKDDIKNVERVSIESVNPISRTTAGRMQMLDWLGERGLVREAKEAIAFLDTGRIEPVYEYDSLNLARIRREKEMLQQGIGMPPAGAVGGTFIRPLMSDTHWIDIPEYLAILAAPEARERPEVVEAVLGLVQTKLAMWREMDPALLALLKGPPAPPPVPAATLGAPAGPPVPPGPPEGQHAPPAAPAPGLPNGPQVKLPSPPKMQTTDGQPIEMPPPVMG